MLISVTGAHVILKTGRKTLIYKEFGPVFSISQKHMGENMMRGETVVDWQHSIAAVYIGTDLPDEYTRSNYTHILKGANAKAKANAAQGLPELIEIAAGKKFTENYKEKHTIDAMYGWYRYESRFALPVFNEVGEIERYNVFNVIMVIRYAKDGKMYLYDIMNIKKETSTLFQSEDITQ